MSEYNFGNLEDQLKKAKETGDELEHGRSLLQQLDAALARNRAIVDDLAKRNAEIKKKEQLAEEARVLKYGGLKDKKRELGSIERIFRTFDALTTTNAQYEAAKQKGFAAASKTFVKTQLQDIKEDLHSVLTGYEERLRPRKIGKDYLARFQGLDKDALSTEIAGIVQDIATSIPIVGWGNAASSTAKVAGKVIDRSPSVKKAFSALNAKFDVWAPMRDFFPNKPEIFAKFQEDVRKAMQGDFSSLREWGQTYKPTPIKAPPTGTTTRKLRDVGSSGLPKRTIDIAPGKAEQGLEAAETALIKDITYLQSDAQGVKYVDHLLDKRTELLDNVEKLVGMMQGAQKNAAAVKAKLRRKLMITHGSEGGLINFLGGKKEYEKYLSIKKAGQLEKHYNPEVISGAAMREGSLESLRNELATFVREEYNPTMGEISQLQQGLKKYRHEYYLIANQISTTKKKTEVAKTITKPATDKTAAQKIEKIFDIDRPNVYLEDIKFANKDRFSDSIESVVAKFNEDKIDTLDSKNITKLLADIKKFRAVDQQSKKALSTLVLDKTEIAKKELAAVQKQLTAVREERRAMSILPSGTVKLAEDAFYDPKEIERILEQGGMSFPDLGMGDLLFGAREAKVIKDLLIKPKDPTSTLGRIGRNATDLYESLTTSWKLAMAVTPGFIKRNLTDSLLKNIIHGKVGLKAYWENAKFRWSGGKKDVVNKAGEVISGPDLYDEFTKGGVYGSTGMLILGDLNLPKVGLASTGILSSANTMVKRLNSALSAFVTPITSFFEDNFVRGPLAMKQVLEGPKGKATIDKAVKLTEEIHYRFSNNELTAFEKGIKRVMPFYEWHKQNIKFYSKMPQGNIYAGIYRADRGFRDDALRENPELTPPWMSRTFGLGGQGVPGLSISAFADFVNSVKKWSFDPKPFLTGINFMLKYLGESISNWNVNAQKPVTEQRSAKPYKNADPLTKWGIGYDPATDTAENVRARHFLESIFGPQVSTFQSLGTKGFWKTISPLSNYNYTPEQLVAMKQMQDKEAAQAAARPGPLAIIRSFFGGSHSSAQPVPVQIVGSPPAGSPPAGPPSFFSMSSGPSGGGGGIYDPIVRKNRSKYFKNWGIAAGLPEGVDAEKAYGAMPILPDDTIRLRQFTRYTQEMGDLARLLEHIGKGEEAQKLRIGLEQYSQAMTAMLTPEQHETKLAALKQAAELQRVRKPHEYFFTEEQIRSEKRFGAGEHNTFFNVAQREYSQILSKTASMWDAAIFKNSVKNLKRKMEIDLATWDMQKAMSKVQITNEVDQARKDAIQVAFIEDINKLRNRLGTAEAKVLKNWAESIPESVEKLTLEMEAAKAEYRFSDEYRMLEEDNNTAAITNAINAIEAKFNFKISEFLAKDAKARAEMIINAYEKQLETEQARLQAAFEEGGMSLKTLFESQNKALIGANLGKVTEATKSLLAYVKTTTKKSVEPSIVVPPEAVFHKPKAGIGFSSANPKVFTGTAQRVIDGDTLEIMNDLTKELVTVRLALVDATEVDRNDPKRSQFYAENAKKHLQEIMKAWDNKINVKLYDKDTHGRFVGELFPADPKKHTLNALDYQGINRQLASLNEYWLATGLGVASTRYAQNPEDFKRAILLEHGAAQNAYGVFGPDGIKKPKNPNFSPTVVEQELPGAKEAVNTLNGLLAALSSLDASKDNIDTIIATIQAIDEQTQKIVTGGYGDTNALSQGAQAITNALSSITAGLKKNEKGYTGSQITLRKAFLQAQDMIATGALVNAEKAVALTPFTPSSLLPGDFTEQKRYLLSQQQAASQAKETFALTESLKGVGLNLPKYNETEDADIYNRALLEKIQTFYADKQNLTSEQEAAIDVIKSAIAEKDKARQLAMIEFDRQVFAQRIQVAQSMTNILAGTFDNLYQLSNKKSQAFFYLSKGMAIAEATIKGIQTIIDAYQKGWSFGGPAAPVLATTYAGIAAAFTASQIALMTSQMFSGQGKAQGGPIVGGSGTKDDIPVMAMGGEYMIRKEMVQKYGYGFFDAINEGLLDIPRNFSHGAIAAIREPQMRFAEGGAVPHMTSVTNIEKTDQSLNIINFVDPNMLEQYLGSVAGQRMVVNIMRENAYVLRGR